jgi:hypothetical protein
MTESIGKIYETAVPSLSESANIQEALRVYHYGKSTGTNPDTQYNVQNETLSELPPKSIASYLNNLQIQITNVSSAIQPEFYAKKGNIVSSDFDGSPRVLELSPNFPSTIAQNGLLLTSDDSTPTGLRWQAPDITLTNIQTISNKTFSNSTIATAGLKFLESGAVANFITTLIAPDQGSNKIVIFPTTDAELPGISTTLVGTNTVQALSNKSFSLGSNTLTGTVDNFNTSLTNADFLTSLNTVTVAQGGTGATTAADAKTNLDIFRNASGAFSGKVFVQSAQPASGAVAGDLWFW